MENKSNYKWINIFIDSNSYNDYSVFWKIEWYYWEEDINIYEIYDERKSKVLPIYKLENHTVSHWFIEFSHINNNKKSSHTFPWKDFINLMTKSFFGIIDNYKIKLTEKLYIAENFIEQDKLTLFITNEISILKKKDKIHEKMDDFRIVDINIAEEILWLFLKKKWKFFLLKNDIFTMLLDEWLYYLYSYRSYNQYFLIDLNNLNLTNEILFKWQSVVKTLDHLWFLYHLWTNNNTSFNTKYYFYNYLVLICWIYDKLSIYLNRYYNLKLNEKQISLNSKWNGYDKLKHALKEKKSLLNIIINNKEKIDIIYKIRNLIVHTEWFNIININWDIIALKINNDIKNNLLSIDNAMCKIKSFYKNWVIKDINIDNDSLLIPFIFSKYYFKFFSNFLNVIFKELWNNKFTDTIAETSDFYKNFKIFREFTLKLDL